MANSSNKSFYSLVFLNESENEGSLLQDMFTCAVCHETFDEGEHKSKMLFCHHTFCCRCLKEIAKSTQETRLVCPTCKGETNIPSGGIEGLKGNHYLLQFLDALEKIDPNHSAQQTDTSVDLCSQHGNTRKYFWCDLCCISVCRHCAVLNHKEGHTLRDIKEAKSSLIVDIMNYQSDISVRVKKLEDKRDEMKEIFCPAQFRAISRLDHTLNSGIVTVNGEVQGLCEMAYKECFSTQNDLEETNLIDLSKQLGVLKTLSLEVGKRETLVQEHCEVTSALIKSRILVTILRPELSKNVFHCPLCGVLTDNMGNQSSSAPDSEFKVDLLAFVCRSCGITSELFDCVESE